MFVMFCQHRLAKLALVMLAQVKLGGVSLDLVKIG